MNPPTDVVVTAPDGCALSVGVTGAGPVVVLLHPGGPDRHSLDPLARRLRHRFTVVQPDIRGYGASRWPDPAGHTWDQYTHDLFTVLDHLDADRVVVAGAGLGSTIGLRAAARHPARIAGVAAIGIEDIEDDEAKAAEARLLEEFARTARREGLHAAWAPILPDLPPVVSVMVADAIPRSDLDSVVAAAAIGADRAFGHVDDLGAVDVPALVFPGTDWRHPRPLAERAAQVMARATLADTAIDDTLHTPEDLADAIAPELVTFAVAAHNT